MKFLIAGYGSIGRRHLQNLHALGQKEVSVFRTGHSTLPDEELAGVEVFTDLSEALATKPDAVIVANPTANHLDVAIPAAEAGCHIFLEKPISNNLDRVDDLYTAVKFGGGEILVGFQFRFHPQFIRAKEILENGFIGELLYGRAHYGDFLPGWHPWEDYRKSYSSRMDMGGGVVLTLCHPMDYLRWFLGQAADVFAFTGKTSWLDIDAEDMAEISLRFKCGAHGSIHLDYYQRPPSMRFEIIGSEGTLAWDNADNLLRLYRSSLSKWEYFDPPHAFERNVMFMEEMRHFINLVQGREKPTCTLGDGVAVLKMALAVHESARSARVVHISNG